MIAPGTTQLTSKDLEFRSNKANAACIITNPSLAAIFDEVADKCETVKSKIVIESAKAGWLFFDDAMKEASQEFETAKTKAEDNCLVYLHPAPPGSLKWRFIRILMQSGIG